MFAKCFCLEKVFVREDFDIEGIEKADDVFCLCVCLDENNEDIFNLYSSFRYIKKIH